MKSASERSFEGSIHEKCGCSLATTDPRVGVTGVATASATAGTATAASTITIEKRRRTTISPPAGANLTKKSRDYTRIVPGVTLRVLVPDSAAGERLDRFLSSLPEVGSRAAAERLFAEDGVRVDGASRAKSHRLAGGEQLELEPSLAETWADEPLVAEDLPVRIAYEDEHILVVDKPAGMVVHPAPGHASGTLVHALLEHGLAEAEVAERPGIVHRLDRDTSGLLVVARSDEAYRSLQELVRGRELERRYLALVRGRPESWRGRIEAPIGRDRSDPTRRSLDTDEPREAVTHFEVERLLPAHALLRARLETGRTHQIRVHLAAIGLPVVGDSVYGVPEPQLGRQFLHATSLAFPHPVTGGRIETSSPLPDDLQESLERFVS
jgi:23S rRNA pseudouridine1911/1915/1917 synthase